MDPGDDCEVHRTGRGACGRWIGAKEAPCESSPLDNAELVCVCVFVWGWGVYTTDLLYLTDEAN